MRLTIIAIMLSLPVFAGCSVDNPLNPAFPLRYADARTDLRTMRKDPRLPVRPIVVAGGIHDPGFMAAKLARDLVGLMHPDAPLVYVSFFGTNTFEQCRQRIIDTVDEAFPSDDPDWTTEVDVVAFSMGGLVARYAAAPFEGAPARRLRVARMFTISSPHQGARWAHIPSFDQRTKYMRQGSTFLEQLDQHLCEASYELYCYVRLGDRVLGEGNAAPPGRDTIWAASKPLSPSHVGASTDARFLADIARRLRGEPAHAFEQPLLSSN